MDGTPPTEQSASPARGVAQKKNGTKPKTSARRKAGSILARKSLDAAGAASGEEETGDDDVYIAEKIVTHREHKRYLSYEYLMRWEGYGPEDDTWEPHEYIIDSAQVLIDEYWAPRGGYEANRLDLPAGSKHKSLSMSAELDSSNTLQKRLRRQTGSLPASTMKSEIDYSEKAKSPTPSAKTARRKSPAPKSTRVKSPPRRKPQAAAPASASAAPAAVPRQSKASSPLAMRPKVNGDGWSPPLQLISWENEATIDTLERDDDDELYVYLDWPEDNQRSRHRAEVVYQKMPQSMLKFYESNVVFKAA